MPKFHVNVREVHVQTFAVEAANEKDAIEKATEGDGTALDGRLEYSYTPDDTSTWTVEPCTCKEAHDH